MVSPSINLSPTNLSIPWTRNDGATNVQPTWPEGSALVKALAPKPGLFYSTGQASLFPASGGILHHLSPQRYLLTRAGDSLISRQKSNIYSAPMGISGLLTLLGLTYLLACQQGDSGHPCQ